MFILIRLNRAIAREYGDYNKGEIIQVEDDGNGYIFDGWHFGYDLGERI